MARARTDRGVGERMAAWRDLTRVSGTVRAAVNRTVLDHGDLTLTDSLVLCEVAHAPGKSLRMAELAESLNVAKSAITKTVDRLEARGLLTRERDDDRDRRAISATLTEDGHAAFTSTMPVLVQAVADHFGALTDEEARQLRALLRKVLDAAPAGAPPTAVFARR